MDDRDIGTLWRSSPDAWDIKSDCRGEIVKIDSVENNLVNYTYLYVHKTYSPGNIVAVRNSNSFLTFFSPVYSQLLLI